MKPLLAALAFVFCLAAPALAQDAPVPLTAEQIVAQIKPLKAKTLILVFDVTESTRHGGVFTTEREASATLMRQGCSPGDRIILIPFGTGEKTVFDKTLTSAADVDPLIDQIPPAPMPGHGTNIRLPHHEALKLIAREDACPAVVVLLTDSFNDRPDLTDPNYPKYRSYYAINKALTVHPDTPENRDYERLLKTLTAKGCLHQYGVGVGIASDGRPIERFPVGPGQGDSDAGATTQAPTVLAPVGTGGHGSPLPAILGAILAALLLGLLLWFLTRRRPVPIRLKLGDKGLPRDFRLLPGTKLALGGASGLASGSADTFPLAGVAAPAAFIQAERGGASLVPAPPGEGLPAVFHNGVALKQPAPLRVGDDLRVAVPATASEMEREHRIRVEDPHGAMF